MPSGVMSNCVEDVVCLMSLFGEETSLSSAYIKPIIPGLLKEDASEKYACVISTDKWHKRI